MSWKRHALPLALLAASTIPAAAAGATRLDAAPPAAAQTAADPVARFTGTARNGSYTGRVVLDITESNAITGDVAGEIHFSEGLYGDGPLEGVLQRGALRMRGWIEYAGTRIPFALTGRVSDRGELTATYTLEPTNGMAPQRGDLAAALERGGASSTAQSAAPRRSSSDIEPVHAEEVQPVRPADEVRPVRPAEPGRQGDVTIVELKRRDGTPYAPAPEPRQSCPAPRAGNAVEPLSDGFRLHWTKAQAREAMGGAQTGWDSRTLQIGGARVAFGGAEERVWHYTIDRGGLCLNSGISLGSTADEVRRVFGAAHAVTYDQYRLEFVYDGAAVSEIKIDPVSDFAPFRADPRFAPGGGEREPARAAPPEPRPTARSVVGTWYGSNSPTTITLAADGTYSSPNGARGRYVVKGDRIQFTGPLTGWNEGRARLKGENVMEFAWSNPDGSYNAFLLYRK